jgi:nucleoid-associated protein YgaU
MQAPGEPPIFEDVTAAVAHPWARSTAAVAPAPSIAARRVTGALHEPNAWTVGIVVATGAVLLARHPIAHLLGTEVDSPPATTVATVAAPPRAQAQAPALSLPVVTVPTHAPRDPFRALVSAGGKVLAPAAAPVQAASAPAPSTPAPSTPAPAAPGSTCTGTSHRVVAGDTLWSIAARSVRSNDSDRVTIAWHRIYAANRSTLGADPALLHVGASLCVPASI